MKTTNQPIFFESAAEFRRWLEENHKTASEVLVGYYKVKSGKKSMSWSESVDQAICFGWIDGIRKSIDQERYMNRFTPRRANSHWSAVNIRKVDQLTKLGLMRPAGLAAFQIRKESRSEIYSIERQAPRLSEAFEKQFRANNKAWDFFETLAPSYQKAAINWVMAAKQETTRKRRLAELIADSDSGLKIKVMRR
ncbi:YdeI/OmpD-associated family protein [Sunxiuqinia dokdonensis]|uniref:Bacteriocin-protection protein n=1 Tax=Sunxiuqinia dokdonensis TaxID=1409788 RepID=A0A0L8V2F6_9BACT|nr:YdeI/OmpD-associated family protein [Sunxiuqinia dokdonensis]KOH42655.1 hypothetical protein NC99_45480 [Sunxiuqinia dokdonensis]